MPLIDRFLSPVAPAGTYRATTDVVATRLSDDGNVVAELLRTQENTFRFRFSVWVAWRDAGDEVRSHDWYEVYPKTTLITDDALMAMDAATVYAERNDTQLVGEWQLKIQAIS